MAGLRDAASKIQNEKKLAVYGFQNHSYFDYGDAVRIFQTRLFARLVADYWLAADDAMIKTALKEGLEVDHDA